MFLIDTDLLHDYFGLNAYKNNKRREGGRDKDVEWKRSFFYLSMYWKPGPWTLLSIDCFCRAPKFCQLVNLISYCIWLDLLHHVKHFGFYKEVR